MTDPVQTDVVIIGAGPVGLFAVFECGMVGLTTQVVDSLDHIGGQCAALYPEKPIYDIPAQPVVLAQDLVSQLEKQAEPFKPGYHLGQQVMSVSKEGDIWTVTTSKGTLIKSRAIIIAGGAGSFGPQKPPLEGLEDFEGTSVFYSVKSREQFRDKAIVIAGGGDSAVDWALSLSEIAKKVSLVHRRDKFRAAPATIGRLHALDAAGRLDLIVPYQLSALEGQDGELSAVIVSDMNGKDRVIEADILLPFFGLASTLGPIADWGLTLERNHIAIDPATGATGVEGIYAVGDMATYPNKIKLILTGFAEAAQAAHAIYRYINPGRDLHFEYSTTSGVPGRT
jgi:thioredoxin reductase (NADPH)